MHLRALRLMRALFLIVIVGVGAGGPAAAKVVDGVDFPDTVTVSGTTLQRNGIGARTAVFMRFYLAALYVEKTAAEASALLGPDRAREVRLAILKDVSKDRFESAARTGFEKNTLSPSPSMLERQKTFLALIPALVPGDSLTFMYEPGVGTTIKGNTIKSTTIPGKDFADALFNIWLGGHPADDGLKAGLLGKSSL